MNHSLPHLDTEIPRASYFLHHPDLSSRMVAADTVPVAEFEQLNIEVCLLVEETPDSSNRGVSGNPMHGEGACEEARGSDRYGLRRNPRLTRRALAAQEDAEPTTHKTAPKAQLTPNIANTADTNAPSLLDTALRRLIGVRGLSSQYRTQGSRGYIPLIDIAPAVWNLQYLQVRHISECGWRLLTVIQSMAAHTEAIPVIANGVARLAKARSTSLREKLLRLCSPEGTLAKGAASVVSADGIRDEVKSRLWSLCQTTIHGDPISKVGVQKNKDFALTDAAPQSNIRLGDVDPGDVGEIERYQYMDDDEAAECLQDHLGPDIWAEEPEEKLDNDEDLHREFNRGLSGEGFDESELGSPENLFLIEDGLYDDEDADDHPYFDPLLITPLGEFEQQSAEHERFAFSAALSSLTDFEDWAHPIDGSAAIAEFEEAPSGEEYMTAYSDAPSADGLNETAEYFYVDAEGGMHLLYPEELSEQESY